MRPTGKLENQVNVETLPEGRRGTKKTDEAEGRGNEAKRKWERMEIGAEKA